MASQSGVSASESPPGSYPAFIVTIGIQPFLKYNALVKRIILKLGVIGVTFLFFTSCLSSAAKAEEYYALGVAYFDLEKYSQAETWFNKARLHQLTRNASEYNLGRVAYETGRYDDAALFFERIIRRDGKNVFALKAAAYTNIKLRKFDKAEEYYQRVLTLVPESYDEGYNYALVLMALGKPEEAEQALLTHTDVTIANNNTERPQAMLLLARAQKEQGKPEAADTYKACLEKDNNPLVRMEYADYLAKSGHKERSLEEYDLALKNEKTTESQKEEIRKAVERIQSGELETNVEGGSEV
jgi:predicted Zn-dependent protease